MPVHVTFPAVSDHPQIPKRVISIAIDPANPNEIYASLEVGGLLRDLVTEPIQLGHGFMGRDHREAPLVLGRLYTPVFTGPPRLGEERFSRSPRLFGTAGVRRLP